MYVPRPKIDAVWEIPSLSKARCVSLKYFSNFNRIMQELWRQFHTIGDIFADARKSGKPL
jgi:hypothetical protein